MATEPLDRNQRFARRLGGWWLTVPAVALLLAVTTEPSRAQGTWTGRQEAACRSLTPASAGGEMPKDADTLVVRWLGFSNFELVYRGNVFLLDAYFDQLSRRHPIGVSVRDITKATAVFVGHAHFDRIADAPTIAKQAGATVVGAEAGTSDYLAKAGLPARQFKAVRSGDVVEYPGVAVEAVLATHGDPQSLGIPAERLEKQQAAIRDASLQQPLTADEQQRDAAIRTRGSTDPRIASAGTVHYLFTFGGTFRLLFADSHATITTAQRQMAQRVAGIDVAILPYMYFDSGIPALVDVASLFRPSTLLLNSHDGIGTMGWASNYPAALAVRGVSPRTRTLDVVYRTPVCFNTRTKDMAIGW